MLLKRVTLLVVATILFAFFFRTDFYGNWLDTKIIPIWDNMPEDREHLSVKERLERRFGLTYYMAEAVDTVLTHNHALNDVVLLPPNEFIRHQVGPNSGYTAWEPVIFYYYTRIKTVWTFSPDVPKSKWAVVVEPTRAGLMRYLPQGQQPTMLYEQRNVCIALVPITNNQQLNTILSFYKDYKPTL